MEWNISYHDIPYAYDDHELQWEDGEGTTTAGNEGSGGQDHECHKHRRWNETLAYRMSVLRHFLLEY